MEREATLTHLRESHRACSKARNHRFAPPLQPLSTQSRCHNHARRCREHPRRQRRQGPRGRPPELRASTASQHQEVSRPSMDQVGERVQQTGGCASPTSPTSSAHAPCPSRSRTIHQGRATQRASTCRPHVIEEREREREEGKEKEVSIIIII